MDFNSPAIRGIGLMALSWFAGLCCWMTIPFTSWIEAYIDHFGFASELAEIVVMLVAYTLAMSIAPSISMTSAYWCLRIARRLGPPVLVPPAWITIVFAGLSSLYVLLLLCFLFLWMLVGHAD